MKNKKLLVSAIVLGGVAVLLVNSKMSDLEAKANPKSVTLYRATVNVEPKEGLTLEKAAGAQHLLEEVRGVPETLLRRIGDAVDQTMYDSWKDSPIARTVKAGEFLRLEHLSALSTQEIGARLRSDGTPPTSDVALSISVTAESAVGYLVSPGDRVDVYSTRVVRDSASGEGQKAVVERVADGLRVFAVDSLVQPTPDERTPVRFRGQAYRTVTLRIPERDRDSVVPRILQARALGNLSLVLRSDAR